MQVSIIIVSWNVKEELKICLKSIQKHTQDIEYEVIVVDNASEDGTQLMIQTELPWVHLIASNTNLGFGTACNRGAEQATGDVLIFLNPDTQITENSFKIMYEYIIQHPDVGMIGPHLLNTDGTHQDSVRRYPQLSDQLIILTKLHNFFPQLKPIQRYLAQDIDYTKEQDVDQVMGACMATRQEVFEKVQGFDERFFVWYEEVDLQKRIHEQLHLRIVYAPITEMIHIKGAGFAKVMSLTSQRRMNRSMRQYFYKHHGFFQAALLTLFQPYSMLLAFLVHLYKMTGKDIKQLKHGQN